MCSRGVLKQPLIYSNLFVATLQLAGCLGQRKGKEQLQRSATCQGDISGSQVLGVETALFWLQIVYL